MTLGNPKRITIWGCGSGTMFPALPSPALTGPGSLAPAARLLPFRHRLPPIVAVESWSVNDGAGYLTEALKTALPLPFWGAYERKVSVSATAQANLDSGGM